MKEWETRVPSTVQAKPGYQPQYRRWRGGSHQDQDGRGAHALSSSPKLQDAWAWLT